MNHNLRPFRLDLPPLGTRVRLRHAVDRYPHFVAPEGAEGVVVEHPSRMPVSTYFAVRMVDPLPGAEEWENEIHWDTDQAEYEGVPFALTVLRDVEPLS